MVKTIRVILGLMFCIWSFHVLATDPLEFSKLECAQFIKEDEATQTLNALYFFGIINGINLYAVASLNLTSIDQQPLAYVSLNTFQYLLKNECKKYSSEAVYTAVVDLYQSEFIPKK